MISFVDLMMINIMKLKECKSREGYRKRVGLELCSFF